ncbi:hypothetical protein BDR26DRAFT_916284 [Obelidium mucronatum]|nr:hypothetical protein BDR26DRAFT_916284 [Obelidium mucronatum]
MKQAVNKDVHDIIHAIVSVWLTPQKHTKKLKKPMNSLDTLQTLIENTTTQIDLVESKITNAEELVFAMDRALGVLEKDWTELTKQQFGSVRELKREREKQQNKEADLRTEKAALHLKEADLRRDKEHLRNRMETLPAGFPSALLAEFKETVSKKRLVAVSSDECLRKPSLLQSITTLRPAVADSDWSLIDNLEISIVNGKERLEGDAEIRQYFNVLSDAERAPLATDLSEFGLDTLVVAPVIDQSLGRKFSYPLNFVHGSQAFHIFPHPDIELLNHNIYQLLAEGKVVTSRNAFFKSDVIKLATMSQISWEAI